MHSEALHIVPITINKSKLKLSVYTQLIVSKVAMMKMVGVLLAIVVVTMAPLGHCLRDNQSPAAVEDWYRSFPNLKPKLTGLRFYLHNLAHRNPPASTPVAQANLTNSSPTKFGLVNAVDAPLTAQPFSKFIIGYAQGLFTFSSQEEMSSLMTHNFVFTEGKYKGSTLSVVGRNPVNAKYREFPLVGGSGDFRMVQGTGIASTYNVDPVSGDDILEVTCFFYRYVAASGDSDNGEIEIEYLADGEYEKSLA